MTKNLQIPTTPKVPAELLLHYSTPAQPWQLATPTPMLRVGGMSPSRPTRRDFLIGAGSLLVLAPYGCGGESGNGAAGEETTDSGTRTVEHELGASEVPADPRRIVALDGAIIPDCLISLGREPVAATPLSEQLRYPVWLQERMEGVEEVGFVAEPNLERIAALGPDLVLSYNAVEPIYDELSGIAPTVAVLPELTQDWKTSLRDIARAVGREERAEQIIEEYQDRAEELGGRLGDQREEISVSIVSFAAEGGVRIYGEGSAPASILNDAGLALASPPESQAADRGGGRILDISRELIPEISGGHVLLLAFGPEDPQAAELQNDPLWQELDAARDDRVYQVNRFAFTNSGPIGANVALDELSAVLGGQGG